MALKGSHPKIAAIYIRTRRGEMALFEQGLLFELAHDLGLGVFDVYIDKECVCRHDRRVLTQLLVDGSHGCFDTILVVDFSRLTRDQNFAEHLLGIFEAYGIGLVTIGG